MRGVVRGVRPVVTGVLAAGVILLGLALPFDPAGHGLAALGLPGAALAVAALAISLAGTLPGAAALAPLGLVGALITVLALDTEARPGYWLLFWGFLTLALAGVGRVSLADPVEALPVEAPWRRRLRAALPPASVPLVLLLIWQGLVIGYDVPKGIFPSVGNVVEVLRRSIPVLLADSYVTFVKEVLLGFALGLASGFLVGVAIAYSRFLQRGFLPLAAAFGAVPIVGLAPVLGRAFGVDWESKAAVVVIVTFFPVVLNTVQGLTLVDPLRLELLRAYAASPREVFFKLRLPNALPFLFNALKLSAVLAVISVIVAEFLIPGPPVGLGQRISLSARRGAYDVVFAAIFVSSLISILFYGLLSALERWLTGWHPSFRERGA